MSKTANKTQDHAPDYAIAHFTGGGGRGYSQAIKLEFLEEETGLHTYQLFPNVTSGSVGFLLAASLYLPDKENPKTPLMTAKDLRHSFPEIAINLPKKPSWILNRNDRTPLEKALRPFLENYTLQDFMATVHTTAHKIGHGSNSCVRYAKFINHQTGDIEYMGAPETHIMDIALATTALPPVLRPHLGQMDLAFSNSIAVPVAKIKQLYTPDSQGLYVRLGNFRVTQDKDHHRLLENYGHLVQSLKAALGRAISDHTYSENLQLAEILFGQNHVYNLEQEIEPKSDGAPSTSAILTTPEQFSRIETYTNAHIQNNIGLYKKLADALGETAIKHMALTTISNAAFGTHALRAVKTAPIQNPIAANDDAIPLTEQPVTKQTETFSQRASTALSALSSAWERTIHALGQKPKAEQSIEQATAASAISGTVQKLD